MCLARTRIVIVVLAALAVAILGVTRLVGALSTPAEVSQVASLDNLTAQVTTAGWLNMDHDMSSNAPGYQMPPAMMPGMPEQGKERLAVTVTVTNTSEATRPLRPAKEFTLRAGTAGEQVTAHSDTFGELPRLAPRNAVTGVLFFDVRTDELGDSPIWIEWTRDTAARLAVPLNGAVPTHSHKP